MRAATFELSASDGPARTGTVTTARGTFQTPCFMPVGTRGAVKLLDAGDLDALAPGVVLANTYHLMMRPGVDTVRDLGGLHRFTGWGGHMLTDSGGFQVFSLGPKVDDDGVTFRSTYDGSLHRFTPENVVAAQEAIGADIQMVLDVCIGLPAPEADVRQALERTVDWAGRARAAHGRADQSLFGIVQGGTSVAMRGECAERIVDIGFDGYAVGGLSVGEPLAEALPALSAALAHLPVDRPRYLMGVGDPVSMVESVALGVDMFDCVLPSRSGRNGQAFTWSGPLNLRNARHAEDSAPLDARCICPTCGSYSRAYLHHLIKAGEILGAMLLTEHNLSFYQQLMQAMRDAIGQGDFAAFAADFRLNYLGR